jgi:Ni/Fe-hydrogenase subunit HybB-like protein
MTEPVRGYYGRPVLQQPSWKQFIPAYLYLGGLAAGSSLLAAGAEATGDQRLARIAHVTAAGALTMGAGALVADLGRPSRFHHMLRVFRPSSPMNLGSWLLTAYAPAVTVGALCGPTSRLRLLGRAATWTAASLAPAVATYTAVLVADTAVPAWHETGTRLPTLFAAGAAASAGGVASAFVPGSAPARRFAIAGALGGAASSATLHRGLPPEVERAYRSGTAARMRRVASACMTGGSALVALGARSRPTLVRAGGAAIAAGALAERLAVMDAGRASVASPEATIAPQRARLEARRERHGALT